MLSKHWINFRWLYIVIVEDFECGVVKIQNGLADELNGTEKSEVSAMLEDHLILEPILWILQCRNYL